MKKSLLVLFLAFLASPSPTAERSNQSHTGSEEKGTYDTYPIGRDSSGSPLRAWSNRKSQHPSGELTRIIHLGIYDPQELATALPPGVEWHGLSSSLDTGAFPPDGPAFVSENSSAHAIWRWIGLTAPDAVVVPDSAEGHALARALEEFSPAEVGTVGVVIQSETDSAIADSFLLTKSGNDENSAKSEMQRRIARSPQEVLEQLAGHYGNDFSGSYIEALALLTKRAADLPNRSVELARRQLDSDPALPRNGGGIAGTLLYADIGEPWAKKRVLDVAAMAFDEQGHPLEAMPTHSEMSDAVFMACPLLARAGEATGEKRYFDQCLRHFEFIAARCRRPDGLYRHSPLNEAAWGRGNGFPALGLALVLPHFPEDHEGRPLLLKAFRDHLAVLATHQSPSGMWYQIVDHPDSYAEFTATNMIGWSIAVGLEHGWLAGADWEARLELAWDAVKRHIGSDGETLLNVCTGTGKQSSLENYYRREAILGRDPRGGAMALMFACEMKKRYTN